jgi:hypothetical protein
VQVWGEGPSEEGEGGVLGVGAGTGLLLAPQNQPVGEQDSGYILMSVPICCSNESIARIGKQRVSSNATIPTLGRFLNLVIVLALHLLLFCCPCIFTVRTRRVNVSLE